MQMEAGALLYIFEMYYFKNQSNDRVTQAWF